LRKEVIGGKGEVWNRENRQRRQPISIPSTKTKKKKEKSGGGGSQEKVGQGEEREIEYGRLRRNKKDKQC